MFVEKLQRAAPCQFGRGRIVPRRGVIVKAVVDAVIDIPWTREAFKEAPNDFFIQPKAIAAEAFHLAHLDRSEWTFQTALRPYRETL